MDFLSYKTFVWPHNPHTYKEEYIREPKFRTENGITSFDSMGGMQRIITGSGVFFGEDAFTQFRMLAKLFDKVSYSRFLLICNIAMLGCMASLCVMRGYLMMLVAAALMAGSYGILFSVSQSATAAAAPAEQRGIAMGTYYLGLDFGSSLGPVIGGALYGGLDISLFYPVLSVFGLLGIGMYFLCRRIYEKTAV